MNRLIVWRHGETEWNAGRRVQGQLDIGLSAVGSAQAATAAAHLAAFRPAAVVASDLRRAADTAAALAELTGLKTRFDVRLRERNFGPWQGLTGPEIAERWPAEYARWRAGEASLGLGIESCDDLAKRTAAAFSDALDQATGGAVHGAADGARAPDGSLEWASDAGENSVAVVVVTHGGAARHGCGALLGWPDPVTRTLRVLDNCHWAELRYDPVRGWQLASYNRS